MASLAPSPHPIPQVNEESEDVTMIDFPQMISVRHANAEVRGVKKKKNIYIYIYIYIYIT